MGVSDCTRTQFADVAEKMYVKIGGGGTGLRGVQQSINYGCSVLYVQATGWGYFLETAFVFGGCIIEGPPIHLIFLLLPMTLVVRLTLYGHHWLKKGTEPLNFILGQWFLTHFIFQDS